MKKTRGPYFTYPRIPLPPQPLAKNDQLSRVLGGQQVFVREFKRIVQSFLHPRQKLTVLDLVTGSGEFSRLMVDIARDQKWDTQVRAVDFEKPIIDAARKKSPRYPQIDFAFHPLSELDKLSPASFDVAVCCFALHLFSTENAVTLLRCIDRVASHGWLLLDLKRSRLLTMFTEAVGLWFGSEQNGNADGVRSTQQAFSAHEMKNLAFHAGISDYHWKNCFVLGQALVKQKR